MSKTARTSKKEQPAEALRIARRQSTAKFNAFDDSVMAAARRQADAIVEDAKKQAQQLYEQTVARQRTDPVVLYRAEASAKLERQIASNKQENRRKLLVYRRQLVNALFAELEEGLQSYAQTDAYLADQAACMQKLAGQIAAGGAPAGPCVVYVRRDERDDVCAAARRIFPGCKVTPANDIRLGGVRVQVGNLLYDATLDYSDSAQRQAFLARCGLLVE